MPVLHPQVTAYLATLPSPQKEISEALRALILTNFPQMREDFKWHYQAYYYQRQRICLARGFKSHVTVEFHYGAYLRDTQGRIEGAGKRTRHIKLRTLADFDPAYLLDLVQQSIVLSQADSPTPVPG